MEEQTNWEDLEHITKESCSRATYFCDAGVLERLGENACNRVLFSLPLFEMGVIYLV